MAPSNNSLDRESLRFFAIMAASISHEIKNSLAVINESAGLLEDFLTMAAERDTAPDPERMLKAVRSVLRNVQRADRTVKNMNRFAHSHDHEIQRVDLRELAALMSDLMERDAVRRGVSVSVGEGTEPVILSSSPYRLECLFYQLLDFGMAHCGPDNRIVIDVDAVDAGARLRVDGLASLDDDALAAFPSPEMKGMLESVQGRLQAFTSDGRIDLHLPWDIGATD